MSILTATRWTSNAELIGGAHALGYIKESDLTLDATFKNGVWWKEFSPSHLVQNDMNPNVACQWHYDVRHLPKKWRDSFDVVALDLPYKLNGTPSEADEPYGCDIIRTWQERHQLIRDGITGCTRVLQQKGILLVKCQDQVCSGMKRWQTIEFANHAVRRGLLLEDQLQMLGTPRPQPGNRRQVHSLQNYSTLLIFRKLI